MPLCPYCRQPASKRNGTDRARRQRLLCRPCRRSFTVDSQSAFAGYHWPADVILMAVRWYLAHPLSSSSVTVLLAERGIDLSKRTVLRWVQHFGPLVAAAVRKHRRRPGRKWYVDEVFFFRKKGGEKRYLYRAIDEFGQVLDVLFREQRDTESATAFFARVLEHCEQPPLTVITDHHQPYVKAVQEVLPDAVHIRTGLHRARGETTKCIERSHVPTRDRLRASRGVKALESGQRFFEAFEAVQALYHDQVCWRDLVPDHAAERVTPHARARAVVTALSTLGERLTRAA